MSQKGYTPPTMKKLGHIEYEPSSKLFAYADIVKSRKFEVLGTRDLFRSIENLNYRKVETPKNDHYYVLGA